MVKKAQRTLHDSQCYQSSDKLQRRSQQPIFGFVLENRIVFLKINWLFAGCVWLSLRNTHKFHGSSFFSSKSYQMQRCRPFEWNSPIFFLHCSFCMKKIKCSIQVQCKEEKKNSHLQSCFFILPKEMSFAISNLALLLWIPCFSLMCILMNVNITKRF